MNIARPTYDEFMTFMRYHDDDLGLMDAEVIAIPEGVTTIYEGTFEYFNMERVILPESLKTIGLEAFTGCSFLRSLEGKPIDQIKVEDWAFDDCDGLADEDGYIVVNRKLFAGPARYMHEHMIIPDGVETISHGAICMGGIDDEYVFRWPGTTRKGHRIVTLPATVKLFRMDCIDEITEILNISKETEVFGLDKPGLMEHLNPKLEIRYY